MGYCMLPGRCNVLQPRYVHPNPVNLPVGGESADNDGDIIVPPLAVDHIRKEKRLAILFSDAAAELPANQRVHFRVFVDRLGDTNEQPGLFESIEVLMKIGMAGLEIRWHYTHRLLQSSDEQRPMVAISNPGQAGERVLDRPDSASSKNEIDS
jgi:hypothetical protein